MKRLGLWAFIVAGIAVVAWSAASWIAPSTSCRGVEMGPGDTCEVSDRDNVHSGMVQTYEQRLEVTRSQAPFGALAGVGMAGFGVWLLRQENKAGESVSVRG